MPVEKVTIHHVNKEDGKKSTYELTASQFAYIVKSRLTWGGLYGYLNAITTPEEVIEE